MVAAQVPKSADAPSFFPPVRYRFSRRNPAGPKRSPTPGSLVDLPKVLPFVCSIPLFSLGSSSQLLFPARARSKPYRPARRKPIWPWRAPPGLVGVRRLHSPVSVPYPPRTPASRPLLSRLRAPADRRPSFPVRRAAACRRHGAKLAAGSSSIRRHGSTAGAN
jgi:hypothetical protein